MVTFVPIFLAFMVGMYNLYWYYDPSVRNIVEVVDHKITTKAQEGFGTCVNIFMTLSLRLNFIDSPWHIDCMMTFCLCDHDSFEVDM